MRQAARFSMALLAAAALLWGVGMSAGAAPKGTPTPGTTDMTAPPAAGKASILKIDFRPVRIELVRSEGDAYYARVAYQCESDGSPLREVEIEVGTGIVTPILMTEPGAVCGRVRLGREFRIEGAGTRTVRVDPYNRIKETNEGNNNCAFSRASFGTGTQYACP